jgi:hypothetical protein
VSNVVKHLKTHFVNDSRDIAESGKTGERLSGQMNRWFAELTEQSREYWGFLLLETVCDILEHNLPFTFYEKNHEVSRPATVARSITTSARSVKKYLNVHEPLRPTLYLN